MSNFNGLHSDAKSTCLQACRLWEKPRDSCGFSDNLLNRSNSKHYPKMRIGRIALVKPPKMG